MDSTTLLACNRRYIVSAVDSRITTRRTNEALTQLKPDYDGHKGEVTHLALHQQDHCYGTQDDWGRVVASSDVTNRVKVWLCDGEEEELLFARNMAEYVGYEKVTALAWTGDSKVAIGDTVGNFIVFNARFATSRYNRTVPKAITAIAPSHADPHIHAVGYIDGSILLIRTNPSFQILFTNSVAHSGPIVSLAWRPEFSAPRTYTEKDGKVHKSSAEDMALLASCPMTKGEFRIWAWSSKNEKLSGFRDEKHDGVKNSGSPRAVGGLHWSRNGKVVQFIEGEVRIWDVKKLQIQSELFIQASKNIIGIAVDGHRGIIYTLDSSGIEKHMIPAKTNYQVPPKSVAAPVVEDTAVPTQIPANNTPSPSTTPPPAAALAVQVPAIQPEPEKVSVVSIPTPTLPSAEPDEDLKPSPTIERTPSIDSLSKVKQMARQIDEDPGLARKRNTQNNFIANAKHKYSFERRKRTISNDDLLPRRIATESPERAELAGQTVRSVSGTSANSGTKGPSIFDIATSGIPRLQGKTTSEIKENIPTKLEAASRSQSPVDTRKKATLEQPARLETKPVPPEETKAVPPPQPSPSFKPMETTRRTDTPPISISIPATTASTNQPSHDSAINPQYSFMSPVLDRLTHESDFTESPILGEGMSIPQPTVSEPPSPSPSTPDSPIPSTAFPLETIVEETPALKINKDSPIRRDNAITGMNSILEEQIPAKPPPPIQPEEVTPRPVQPRTTSQASLQGFSAPRSSSSTSSKLAEPTSSYEDLGGISMDDHSPHDDARSDTSIEPMDSSNKSLNTIIIPEIPITPQPTTTTFDSPKSPPKTPSRASKIWAEKGKNIHVQEVEYLSDEEEEASPMYKPPPSKEEGLDSPTPYKHSLRDYDLFRDLTRQMTKGSKERLEIVLATKLNQRNVANAIFGMEIRDVVKRELEYVKGLNIGLSELILKLWLGMEIDDEALLKAILFGKNNGLSDALVLAIAPLAGIEAWESLMLWCSESCSNAKPDLSNPDLVKGNALARTHIYAGFLCYNGSWTEAMEVYQKAKMYREGILVALMAVSSSDTNEEVLVESLKSQFHVWGDQIAAQEGDGLLVSTCFAASMMSFVPPEPKPKPKPRKPKPIDYEDYEPSSSRTSPSPPQSRKVSDPIYSKPPVIPVIRTQKPSPTETSSSKSFKGSLSGPDSPHGRNWSELASFMKKQKEKGYSEIRAPKTVQFKDEDVERGSPRTKPMMPRPRLPPERPQRSASPSGRQIPVRRHTDDEDWSRRQRRPSLKDLVSEESNKILSPVSRKPTTIPQIDRSSPSGDTTRRRPHETTSPLTFGARGLSIKPSITDPPPVPIKDEKREKTRESEKRYDYGVGLGIQHGVKERRA